MNCFNFTGRLGNYAERRATPGGMSVCNFSVAVDSGYGDKKTTTWIRCALWGKRAEGGLTEYLTKGALVGVSGELSAREYEHNGQMKTSIEVNVRDITLLGSKPEGLPQQISAPQSNTAAGQYAAIPCGPGDFGGFDDMDGIPF